jgi:hypothetical protein
MLAATDDCDGFPFFEMRKRHVFDRPAQAKVFLERFIGNGEQLIAADGAPPVQPDCDG